MKIYYILIITLCIIIFFYIYINKNICSVEPESYLYDSVVPGPYITIVGTTHGNEQVGYYAIKQLIDRLNSKKIILLKGKLGLIPIVNYCGFRMNTRNGLFFYDINRNYLPDTSCTINKKVIEFTKDSEFTLDFHEGWGYHTTSTSIGSTITPSITTISNEVAVKMKNNVNNTITDNMKQFIIRTNDAELLKDTTNYKEKTSIDGSLSSYMETLNKNYVLIEITGQNQIQPMDLRVKQAMIFIETTLSYYNMI